MYFALVLAVFCVHTPRLVTECQIIVIYHVESDVNKRGAASKEVLISDLFSYQIFIDRNFSKDKRIFIASDCFELDPTALFFG